jgi:hypothetical protein
LIIVILLLFELFTHGLLYYGVHILPTAQDGVLGATEELPEKLKLNSQKK